MPIHSFTKEDLLQYLYGETSEDKAIAIKDALGEDWDLQEAYNMLSAAHQQLETIKFSPRKQTIENILKYAEKGLEEVTSHA